MNHINAPLNYLEPSESCRPDDTQQQQSSDDIVIIPKAGEPSSSLDIVQLDPDPVQVNAYIFWDRQW